MIMNILKHIFISAGPFAGLTDSKFIVNFLLLVDSKIYELFDTLYGLYLSIASARIFDINTFDAIINNIYVFFGVVALFILAFNLLQAMINPDDLNKSTNSIKQFISRFAIAVFLTCITPTLFDFLYDFQEAIMKFQVIPKAILGDSGLDTTQTSIVGYQNENGEFLCTDGSVYNETENPCELKTTEYEVDVGNAILTSDGYGIAYHVFRGFMHPSGTASDVEVKASEYFTSETGFWATWGGCAVGAVGTAAAAGITALVTYFTGGTATGFAATLTTKTGALAATACVAAAGIGYTVNSVGEAITANKYLWSQAERAMLLAGDFSTVPAFDSAVVNGDMSYTPIVSTVAGLILVYLVFSFCLDLGVRAAKLIFYQLLAPISFLISTIPSKKDLMSKWFKAVLTTWMEVFVRIFVMCGTALLIRELNLDGLSELELLAQGIIVLGLVTFAKQFPKLLSEITGISSGNMKLGIKEKLAEGGAFTAGALVGGGLTAGVRNLTNAGKNVVNKYQQNRQAGKGRLASAFGASGTAIRGLGSTAAGVVSGGVRSGKAGLGAKSFKDMKGAAGSGASAAVNARDKRAAYKAAHGGTIIGAMEGHVKDTFRSAGEWAGISVSAAEVENYYTKAASVSKSYNDAVEKSYKTKDAYIELDNQVKALKNLKNSGGATAEEEAELIRLENSLKQMRIDESMKKVTNLRSAAYQLSYDHKMNYYNDKEMVAEFESGLSDGFFDKKGSTATLIGLNSSGEYEFDVKDASGAITRMTLDSDTYKVYDAMKNGTEFDEKLINASNIIRVQDAIDNINIHRQNLNTRKADEAFRAKQEKKKQDGK